MRGLSKVLAGIGIALALGLSAGPASAMGKDNDNQDTQVSQPSAYDRAVKEVEAKNYRNAIRLLTEVVADQPRNANALNYLGFSHRKLGEFPTAVAFYTRALGIDPDHRGANEYLGEAYLELKNLAKAEERLAHLWNICGQSCEEYRVLNQAVMNYKRGGAPNQSSRAGRW